MKLAADNIYKNIAISVSLVGLLVYFGVFNRYHLIYLEQIQLFRYSADYLTGFFQEPGGLICLLGSFFTQFFRIPWLGAILLTLSGFLVYQQTRAIFMKQGLKGVLFPLLPLALLAALHSNHNFPLAFTLGYLLSLVCFNLYISISKNRLRFLAGLALYAFMYYGAGVFSFLTIFLFILYEILHIKGTQRYFFILTLGILSFLVPYLSWKYGYLIPLKEAWLLPVSF